MNAQTVQMIISLIPVAEKLIFEVGGRLIELNTENITSEDMIKAIKDNKSGNWPKLNFSSPNKG